MQCTEAKAKEHRAGVTHRERDVCVRRFVLRIRRCFASTRVLTCASEPNCSLLLKRDGGDDAMDVEDDSPRAGGGKNNASKKRAVVVKQQGKKGSSSR